MYIPTVDTFLLSAHKNWHALVWFRWLWPYLVKSLWTLGSDMGGSDVWLIVYYLNYCDIHFEPLCIFISRNKNLNRKEFVRDKELFFVEIEIFRKRGGQHLFVSLPIVKLQVGKWNSAESYRNYCEIQFFREDIEIQWFRDCTRNYCEIVSTTRREIAINGVIWLLCRWRMMSSRPDLYGRVISCNCGQASDTAWGPPRRPWRSWKRVWDPPISTCCLASWAVHAP